MVPPAVGVRHCLQRAQEPRQQGRVSALHGPDYRLILMKFGRPPAARQRHGMASASVFAGGPLARWRKFLLQIVYHLRYLASGQCVLLVQVSQ